MNSFYRYVLQWICKRLVIQGYEHKQNIVEYYKIMQEAAENEFTEDNRPTLDGFLNECHEVARDEVYFQGTGYPALQRRNQAS